jgi:hypothetical protein
MNPDNGSEGLAAFDPREGPTRGRCPSLAGAPG